MVRYATEQNSFQLILVIALLEEAKPFIKRFNLQKWETSRLKAYENGSILLVISGTGSDAITLAVGYAAALASSDRRLFWLNLGSAGHPSYQIGTVILPAEVRDSVSNAAFYPTLVIPGNFRRDKLKTLEVPSQKYMQDTCFDMEGYSFCTAASRFSLKDYIQVIKIISDNQQNPMSNLRKSDLKNAIAAGAEEAICIIEAFLDFARAEVNYTGTPPALLDTGSLHFTQSQRIKLARLTSQMRLLDPNFDLLQEIEHHESSNSVLNYLTTQVRLCQSRIIND